MFRLLALVLALAGSWEIETDAQVITGVATYMAPRHGPQLENVAARKGISLEGYVGGVALNRKADIGRIVWLQWDDGEIDGPFLVIDCAQGGQHYIARLEQDRVVEVGARVAKERGFYGVGPEGVTVWFLNPQDCYGLPGLWYYLMQSFMQDVDWRSLRYLPI